MREGLEPDGNEPHRRNFCGGDAAAGGRQSQGVGPGTVNLYPTERIPGVGSGAAVHVHEDILSVEGDLPLYRVVATEVFEVQGEDSALLEGYGPGGR